MEILTVAELAAMLKVSKGPEASKVKTCNRLVSSVVVVGSTSSEDILRF